ncbi:uncharacterized protein An02g10410 [Aspergillus niger]|uniref:Contig An02c0310, genomic contig n=2 Tax=Aspergillus niger TaxID=5061 RepID=A5AAE8_ASPNC|nr:uncharacterized protein An02g10410 [Aspergillus niger]CAK44390.1 unnamed protein product [Aspergillus niger]
MPCSPITPQPTKTCTQPQLSKQPTVEACHLVPLAKTQVGMSIRRCWRMWRPQTSLDSIGCYSLAHHRVPDKCL